MSRGPGRAQRAVLEAVAAAVDDDGRPHWVSVDEVLRRSPATRSERESIRRAIRTLGRTGAVEVGDVRRRGEGGDRWHLAARLPLTTEQRIAELEHRSRALTRLARLVPNRTAAPALYDEAIEAERRAAELRAEVGS